MSNLDEGNSVTKLEAWRTADRQEGGCTFVGNIQYHLTEEEQILVLCAWNIAVNTHMHIHTFYWLHMNIISIAHMNMCPELITWDLTIYVGALPGRTDSPSKQPLPSWSSSSRSAVMWNFPSMLAPCLVLPLCWSSLENNNVAVGGGVFPVLSRRHYLEARVLISSAYYNLPALLLQFFLSPTRRCCIAGVYFWLLREGIYEIYTKL